MIGESLNPAGRIPMEWIDPNKYTKVRPCFNGFFVYCDKNKIVWQVTRFGRQGIKAQFVPNLVKWITMDPPKEKDNVKK